MGANALDDWIGRTEQVEDLACPARLAGLAALLDHETPPWREGEIPPLGHWLYFLPTIRQSEIGVDGHPRKGRFLPPIDLPRRMWAGGRLTFIRQIPAYASITRRSTIAAIEPKMGASGAMVFVTVRHEISIDRELAVTEEQDLVYRAASFTTVNLPAIGRARASDITRRLQLDAVELFRFSALTFNAHRIHYDRSYATMNEGYPGLVVQGPFMATLLLDHFLRGRPGAAVTDFSFRARAPVYDGSAFVLNQANTAQGAELWATDETKRTAMTATVTLA